MAPADGNGDGSGNAEPPAAAEEALVASLAAAPPPEPGEVCLPAGPEKGTFATARLPSDDDTVVVDDSKEGPGKDAIDKDADVEGAPPTPDFPDGGFVAWTVVFAMFLVEFFVCGIANSVGVFIGYFVNTGTFPGAANTQLSLCASLTMVGMNLYGPVTGALADRISYRGVACTGAILTVVAGVTNSFANQVWTLFVGTIIQGLGFSCLITPALGLPGQYFYRRLPLAIGIGMSGVGFGGAVLTPVSQVLLDSFGWRWAMRGIGIVGGAILFCAALMLRTRKDLPPRKAGRKLIDATLFRNATYWKLAAMCFFFPSNFLVPLFFLPQQMSDLGPLANGISAAVCLAVLNVCTGIGQLTSGFVIGRLGILNFAVLVNIGVLLSFFPVYILCVSTTGAGLLAFCIMTGYFGAPFPVLVSNIAAGAFGQKNFASTVGMIFVWMAPGTLVAGAVLGAIADANSAFGEGGARLSTNWAPVIAYGGAAQVVLVAMTVWLRVGKGWRWMHV
ncbi:major facilitator superfamily domain-containing protein [Hyaloraphidium curvatum]|nr:major facilitator superfamily domain-containing protein [Hyaloraphidium curvatum]